MDRIYYVIGEISSDDSEQELVELWTDKLYSKSAGLKEIKKIQNKYPGSETCQCLVLIDPNKHDLGWL